MDTFKPRRNKYKMEELKKTLSRYADVSKRLNEVNANATKLRDERRTVELDLTALYASEKNLPTNIELKTSGLVFSVKQPNQWKKGWTLSKKELKSYLEDLLPKEPAEELMNEIVRRQEAKMVETDYGFELKVAKRD